MPSLERQVTNTATAAQDWKEAFAEKSANTFAESLADDVVLEATTLNFPVTGRDSVKRVMAAASKLYESLTFTDQATSGRRQYIEWTARAFGGVELLGVTILVRDQAGAIVHVAIHHRPMQAAMLFSVRIGESLRGDIDAEHFLQQVPAIYKERAQSVPLNRLCDRP
jgi:hypothetical protein